MLNYEIFVVVINEAENLKKSLSKVKGKDKLTVINNGNDPDVEKVCNEAADQGATIISDGKNIGKCASWNIALSKLEKDLDFVVCMSPSEMFLDSEEKFIRRIEYLESKAKMMLYMCNDYHCVVTTKLGLQILGYHDENIWPIGEDMDFYPRMFKAKFPFTDNGTWQFPNGVSRLHAADYTQTLGWASWNKGIAKAIITDDWQKAFDAYQIKKWGACWKGPIELVDKMYDHPFNDPTKDIRWWPKPIDNHYFLCERVKT